MSGNKIPKARRWINATADSVLVMDGYDDCIVGIVTRFGQDPIVCYDREKVIAKLMKDFKAGKKKSGEAINNDQLYQEAEEFFEYNQIGAWMGNKTPCFIELPPK
jgi:hypothetical protein